MNIKVKQIVDEDFSNYKKPAMLIAFPSCSFKCEKECGKSVCQNSELAKMPTVDIDIETIIDRYANNALTSALVLGGLEPFDSEVDLYNLVSRFREVTNDDIVIYTGYTESELEIGYVDEVPHLIYLRRFLYHLIKEEKNIIIKFGRFIPCHKKHYDEVLGVDLASDNQYGKRL